MPRRLGRADNGAMRRLRHAWPHGILFAYALAILCGLIALGNPRF
jgi:hypothetical protein